MADNKQQQHHLTQRRIVILGGEDQVYVKYPGESNFILITGLYECKTADQFDEPLENVEIECIEQPVENEDQSTSYPTENSKMTTQRIVILGGEDQVYVKYPGESNFILITGLHECKTADQIDQPLENVEIKCIKQPVENEDQSINFSTEN